MTPPLYPYWRRADSTPIGQPSSGDTTTAVVLVHWVVWMAPGTATRLASTAILLPLSVCVRPAPLGSMVGFHPCKPFRSSSNLLSCRTGYGVFPKQRHLAELTQKYRCWCHPVAPNLICGSCDGLCNVAWRCCSGTVVGACSRRNTVLGPCTPSRTNCCCILSAAVTV